MSNLRRVLFVYLCLALVCLAFWGFTRGIVWLFGNDGLLYAAGAIALVYVGVGAWVWPKLGVKS